MQETLAASAPGGTRTHTPEGHQSLNLACLPKFHHGHIIFDYQQANPHKRDQPVRPAGLEPTHPNKRGTGLSFRRVYHSTTGTKASQSRRTTGSYRSIISHAATRAQAVDAPTPATLVSRHDAVGLNGIEPLSLRHSGRSLYPESCLAGLEHRLASSN